MNDLFSTLLVLLLLLNASAAKARLTYGNESPLVHFYPDTSIICVDTNGRLLLYEDTIAVNTNFITKTRDGNFLMPGYYYPDRGYYYSLPYLIKSTPEGNIVWTKRFSNPGTYSSSWITASRIKELNNGDLLMTGQIGIPGTDDRRELAIWRLDKNGRLIWSTSYESSLWINPITGATEITGIEEDAGGNIYLCGGLKMFEASKFAFVLKLNASGGVLWDKNYSSNSVFAFGLLLLQNQVLLVGNSDLLFPGDPLNKNVLWCLQLNTADGETISTKGWYADFYERSYVNSFSFANASVKKLDNGSISVVGTTQSDFLGLFSMNIDTINHSIIANFSPEFDFLTGIMLSSRHASNYYNTVATQQENGRIAYTRFVENNNLFNEDIIYGSIQYNQVIKERIYHEQNRSVEFTSNFIFFAPDTNIVIQTYWNNANTNDGLEMVRISDRDSTNLCYGKDTSLTFIQPYFMKGIPVTFDSIVGNAFRPTYHNFVSENAGNLVTSTGCTLSGVNVRAIPVISLDKDSVLCKGSTRELSARQEYGKYVWSNGSTAPSLFVSDTGKYWVTVTGQDGCIGSDTTYISIIAPIPAGFLPHDMTICQFDKLTLRAEHSYQSYLWNDLSTDSVLTVSQPGVYRLDVTDGNHCVGRDSMTLTQKQCLEGLFVPNAFTPNGDGRNDIFRPLLYGDIIRFRFAVYNRWGEKIFETSRPGQGWDGKLNGVPAVGGTFVWYCYFQLEGQEEKTRTGTVLLIR